MKVSYKAAISSKRLDSFFGKKSKDNEEEE
jgi:hypothetical protein